MKRCYYLLIQHLDSAWHRVDHHLKGDHWVWICGEWERLNGNS